MPVAALHAPGHPGPDEGGAGQAGEGVEGDEGHADRKGQPPRAHEAPEREGRVGPGRLRRVDAGLVGGRWQGCDLGHEPVVGVEGSGEPGVPGVVPGPGGAAGAGSGPPGAPGNGKGRKPAAGAGRNGRPAVARARIIGPIRCRRGGRRTGQQVPVAPAGGEQLVMGAVGHHPAALDEHDPVGQGDGRAPVGDHDRRPARHQPAQRGVDLRLHRWIHRRGGVVEDEDAGVGEQRPGQRDPLALPAGEGEAPLPHHGAVPVGQRFDESVGLRRPGRGPDLLVGGVGDAVGDVVADGGGEQEGVLEDDADAAAQVGQAQAPDVPAVQAHLPGVDVVEAGQQQGERRLPRSARPDQGDALAGPDPEREAVEERSRAGVAEAHVGEIDVAGHLAHRFCVGRVGHVGAGVEQGEDAHRPGPGDLPGGHDHGDHAGGGGQLDQVGVEGQERAQRDPPVEGHPPADEEEAGHAEAGEGLDEGHEPGLDPHVADLGGEEGPGRSLQAGHLPLLGGEGLDHPHARYRLFDHAGDLGGPLLGVPGGGEDPGAHADGGGGHRRKDDEGDGGEREAEGGHHRQRQDEHDHVAEEQGQEGEQHLDHADVAARPGDGLARLQPVVGGEVEPLKVLVDGVAQVVLDVVADAPGEEPPPDRGGEADDPEAEQGGEAGGGKGPAGGDLVDEVAEHQRPQHRGHHADQRAPERQGQVAAVPPEQRGQAPEPSPRFRRGDQGDAQRWPESPGIVAPSVKELDPYKTERASA